MEDLTVLIVMGLCGLLFLYLGYLIWIKEKIELIHDYHYKNVKAEDKKAYTGLMGKAVMIIGTGQIISGLISLVDSEHCMIAFVIAFIIGFIIITYAQIKYNHGIFSHF